MRVRIRHVPAVPRGHPRARRRWSWLALVPVLLGYLVLTPVAAGAQVSSQCYAVADSFGTANNAAAEDLLTRVDRTDPDPATNETNIGTGTGSFNVEAIAFQPGTGILFATDAGQLGTIDLVTGRFTALAAPAGAGPGAGGLPVVTFDDLDGLSFDPTSGILYGTQRETSGPDLLVVLDPATGAHVPGAFGPGADYVRIGAVGDLGDVDDIAIDPLDGLAYASVNRSGQADALVRVDLLTGATTLVGEMGVNDMEGLGFDVDGQLLGTSGMVSSSRESLWDLDKTTGVASNPRVLDNARDYEGLDCLVDAPLPPPPAILIEKLVNGAESVTVHPGDPLAYTFTVTNTGPVALTVYQLTDVRGGSPVDLPTACDALVGTVLDPGGTFTCDYDGGPAPSSDVANTAAVGGRDILGRTVTSEDTATVLVIDPAISLVKLVNGAKTVTVHEGDPLTYTLEVSNTGTTALTITELTDVAAGADVTLPADCTARVGTVLAVGAGFTCTYTATAPAADISNSARVGGTDVLDKTVEATDTATVLVIAPAILIEKLVNGAESVTVHAGDPLTYTLKVTNTGPDPLEILDLTDAANGVAVALPADCTDHRGEILAPGESFTCSYTTVAPAGDVVNTARVTGADDLGETVESTDTATVLVIRPAILLEKLVNGAESVTVHAGDPLTYTLKVTNTGSVDLTVTSLTDVANSTAVALPAECLAHVGAGLAVGASFTCTYSTTAPAVDVANTAVVTGRDPLDGPVTSTDTADVDVIRPAIAIVKTADPISLSPPAPVTFTYLVTNTGDTALFNVEVTDDILGLIGTVPTLAPGASTTLTSTITATTSTPARNVGTAAGADRLGLVVRASDDAVIALVLADNPTRVAGATLPRTGSDLKWLAAVGMLLVLVGTGMARAPEGPLPAAPPWARVPGTLRRRTGPGARPRRWLRPGRR